MPAFVLCHLVFKGRATAAARLGRSPLSSFVSSLSQSPWIPLCQRGIMSNAEGRSPSALLNLSLPLSLKGRCFALCLKTKGVAPLHEATPSCPVCCCTCPLPSVYWAIPCCRAPCPSRSPCTTCHDGSGHIPRRPSPSASTSLTPSSWDEWPPGTSGPESSRPTR